MPQVFATLHPYGLRSLSHSIVQPGRQTKVDGSK